MSKYTLSVYGLYTVYKVHIHTVYIRLTTANTKTGHRLLPQTRLTHTLEADLLEWESKHLIYT